MTVSLDPDTVINRLFDAKRFGEMREYCDMLLKKDPKNLLALQNASLACLNLSLYADALTYSDAVLKDYPKDKYAIQVHISALENFGEYEKVLELCDTILKDDPDNVWILNTAGLAAAELDLDTDALGYLESTLGRDPRNVTALMNKALILGRTGMTHDSIKCYDQVLLVDSSMKAAAAARAEAYVALGMKDEAFLAAQSFRDAQIQNIIARARINRCSVLHQISLDEMETYQDRDPHANNPFRHQQ